MRDVHDFTQPTSPMPGPSSRTALLAWGVLLALLMPLFMLLASHPSWFLAVEKEQPSRCLVRAGELAHEGRYEEALTVLERGVKFYQEQLSKTGSARHRMMVARVYHSMGLILLQRNQPGDREMAGQKIRQGVEVDPTIGGGEGQLILAGYEREIDPVSALARYAGVVAAVSDRQAILARRQSAEILAELGRWEEALEAHKDSIHFQSGEPDEPTSRAFIAVAEKIGSGTGSALARSYLRLNLKEKAVAQLRAAVAAGDPVAQWYLSETLGSNDYDPGGIVFDPQRAFAASAGVNSVSFTWPAGCMVEFTAGKQSAGRSLIVTLQPDRLRPQKIQLPVALNGQYAGLIEITRGGPSDYQTSGLLNAGRNVLEIRCAATIWFEPDDRPVITLVGLKPGGPSAER